MGIYRGDIYFVRNYVRVSGSEQTAERPAIVVSNDIVNEHSDICQVVYLTTKEKKPLPTHAKVMCRVPSTALCEQVFSVSQDRLVEYIRTCTEAEMKAIDRCLMISLGLTESTKGHADEDSEKINDLEMMLKCSENTSEERRKLLEDAQKQLADAIYHIEKLKCEITHVKDISAHPVEVVALTTERNLYKQQYEMLLEKLVGA